MAMLRMRWAALALAGSSMLFINCSSPNDGERSGQQTPSDDELSAVPQVPHRALCEGAEPGFARCHALVRTDAQGNAVSMATPSGFGPSDLRSAYNMPSSGGNGKIVAIVDAQDNPNAEKDLATYRSTYGLPPCTTANG